MVTKYPEHEKLKLVKDKSQAIGEFLEWLQQQGILLCTERPGADEDGYQDAYRHHHESTENLLARFFNIDLTKIEAEKREMLDEMRKANRRGS